MVLALTKQRTVDWPLQAWGVRLKKMTVFYQYGLSFSKLSGSTAGSHELSVSFQLKSKRDTVMSKQPELW
jgi:hypothetical protein